MHNCKYVQYNHQLALPIDGPFSHNRRLTLLYMYIIYRIPASQGMFLRVQIITHLPFNARDVLNVAPMGKNINALIEGKMPSPKQFWPNLNQ